MVNGVTDQIVEHGAKHRDRVYLFVTLLFLVFQSQSEGEFLGRRLFLPLPEVGVDNVCQGCTLLVGFLATGQSQEGIDKFLSKPG